MEIYLNKLLKLHLNKLLKLHFKQTMENIIKTFGGLP